MKKQISPEDLNRSPYVGPRPFEPGEVLFGRDQEKQGLESLLRSRRVVLMYSPSGAGKTSLIQAGLLPLMKLGGIRVLPVIRVNKDIPKDHPLPPGPPTKKAAASKPTVNRFIFSVLASLDDEKASIDHLLELSTRADGLNTYLDECANRQSGKDGGASGRTLLVFDQFEEILTTDPVDTAGKHRFFECLMSVLNDPRNLVLFSMREDFIAGLDPYLIYFPERLSVRFRLELLGKQAAMKAVQEPARRKKVEFLKSTAEELVSRLSKVNVFNGGVTSEVDSPFVEPVHLQVVCERLWSAPNRDPVKITLDDLAAIGSVEKALGSFYNDKVAEVARLTNKPELNLREWIERRLITPQKVRNQAMAGQEQEFGLDAATIYELTRVYLVRKDERRSTAWYELAHDRLIGPILQANTEWRVANKLFYRTPDELGTNLEEAGWGILLSGNVDPQPILQALKPLLDLRKSQVGQKNAGRYHEFVNELGYRPGETAQAWLSRQKADLGQYNPEWVPTYLLLVGNPEEIPFEFQYGLDVQYAVGRICFEKLEDYATYALSVAYCESGAVRLPNQAVIFAPQNPGDAATRLSCESLARPLTKRLAEVRPNWNVKEVLQEQATKANLTSLLGGKDTSAVLLTASHAMKFAPEDANSRERTGALLCQDWPGPNQSSPKMENYYFAASDLRPEARVLGMVAFLWGTHTAGMPRDDREGAIREKAQNIRTGKRTPLLPKRQAPFSFISRLPQRLLSHPLGGALAVIGITWLGWSFSFTSSEESATSTIFDYTMVRLMEGYTVGRAMNLINQRAAMLASRLDEALQEYAFGDQPLSAQFPRQVLEYYDARDYILIGDPAVHLPVEPARSYMVPAVDWQWPILPGAQVPQTAADPTQDTAGKPDLPLVTPPEPIQTGQDNALVGADPTFGIDTTNVLDSASIKKAHRWKAPDPSQADVENWYLNGINPSDGNFWLPPFKVAEMAEAILKEKVDEQLLNELRVLVEMRVSYGVTEVDLTDLRNAGWGVIFAPGKNRPEFSDLLKTLTNLRRQQTPLYKEFEYHAGDTVRAFLARQGVGPGPLQPDRVPYYLLLVGSPEEIPFSFQADLSRRYAVGRLHFDQPSDYNLYASNVYSAETQALSGGALPGLAVFGPQAPRDAVGDALSNQLVKPLAEYLSAQSEALNTWVHVFSGEEATKAHLQNLLLKDRPGLIFFAGQGVVYDQNNTALRVSQGGLITQDWPGPKSFGLGLLDEHVFKASDLPLLTGPGGGFVLLVNSCSLGFSGVTNLDLLFPQVEKSVPHLPPFISALPQQLLGRPSGPLGVIGMVGHAWSPGPGTWPAQVPAPLTQWEVFRDALVELNNGTPAGHALRLFQQYFAMSYVATAEMMENIRYQKQENPLVLVSQWAARNDFGNLALLGDPAARLNFESGGRRQRFTASKISIGAQY